jgi:hypothetical protein
MLAAAWPSAPALTLLQALQKYTQKTLLLLLRIC